MAVIPDYVTEARTKSDQASQALQGYAGKEYTIADELKKVLNDVTAEGKKDWADIRGKALSDYLASPAQARSMYMNPDSPQNIFDPVLANKTMQEYIQGSEIPFFSANTLFGMMNKGEGEMIEAGTNAFKAQSAAAQAAAQAARQTYQDVFSEFTTLEEMRRADEQLALEKAKLRQSGVKQPKIDTIQLGDKIYRVNMDTGEKTELGPAAISTTPEQKAQIQADILSKSGLEFTLDPKTWTITDVGEPEDERGVLQKGWNFLFGQ